MKIFFINNTDSTQSEEFSLDYVVSFISCKHLSNNNETFFNTINVHFFIKLFGGFLEML